MWGCDSRGSKNAPGTYFLGNAECPKLLPMCVEVVQGFCFLMNSLALTKEVFAVSLSKITRTERNILTICFVGFDWGI